MEALKTEGLCKNFGGVQAVKDVSFKVEAGEKVAIIGPNGAGKTTLFNLINGQEKVTTGKVYLFGQDVTKMPAYSRAQLGQGRSYQLLNLFPKLSVLHSILLAVQGTESCRFQLYRPITAYKHLFTKAQKLLDEMELWDKRNEVVQTLGYGEQRELEIAVSLASEPKLLLLDEPSCGLTTEESADIINIIRDLGPDITVVLIAHDMDLVFGLANRIIVLHNGQIIADAVASEIQADPRVKEIYMGLEEETGNARAS